jgi:uncharacterized membrane protein
VVVVEVAMVRVVVEEGCICCRSEDAVSEEVTNMGGVVVECEGQIRRLRRRIEGGGGSGPLVTVKVCLYFKMKKREDKREG